MAAGGRAGGATFLLEAGVGGPAGAGAADRSTTAGGAELPRRTPRFRAWRGSHARAEGARPTRGRHIVHDAARRVPGAPVSLQRAGRCGGRVACCLPPLTGAGGVDRFLSEHTGAACGTVWET